MTEWVYLIRWEPLTYFFEAITFLGNEEFLLLFIPLLYWNWRKDPAVALMFLLLLAGYISLTLKGVFQWERPPMELWLVNARGYTFPSSHAVTAVVLFAWLAHEIRRSWFSFLSILMILLVAFSRVYLGVHYIQDVLAGLALGTTIFYAYLLSFNRFRIRLQRLNNLEKGVGAVVLSIVLLLLQQNIIVGMVCGLFAGVVVGILVEPYFAEFSTAGNLGQKIARSAIGLLILASLWQTLVWFLPDNPAFTWFQFFIIGAWMTAASPWIFMHLRLMRKE